MKFTFETSTSKQFSSNSKPSNGFKLKFSSVGAVVSTSPAGARTSSRITNTTSTNASQTSTATITTCSSSSSWQPATANVSAPVTTVQDSKQTLQATVKRKAISPYKSKQSKSLERQSQKLHNVPQPPAKKSLSSSLENFMPEKSVVELSSASKDDALQTKEELGVQSSSSPILKPATPPGQDRSSDSEHLLEGIECISDTMSGMIFAVLGRKFKIGRSEIVKLILSHGGKVSEKITAKVTHLLCMGDEDSAKYKNAVQRGIPVLNEEDIFCIIKQGQQYINTIDVARLYPRGYMRVSSPIQSDSDNNNSPTTNNKSSNKENIPQQHSPSVNNLPNQSLQKQRKNNTNTNNNNCGQSKSQAAPLESLMKVVDTELSTSEANCAALLMSLANAVASVKVEN